MRRSGAAAHNAAHGGGSSLVERTPSKCRFVMVHVRNLPSSEGPAAAGATARSRGTASTASERTAPELIWEHPFLAKPYPPSYVKRRRHGIAQEAAGA